MMLAGNLIYLHEVIIGRGLGAFYLGGSTSHHPPQNFEHSQLRLVQDSSQVFRQQPLQFYLN